MRGRLAHWISTRIDMGSFESRADISTFVLYTVLTATVLATGTYLAAAAVLAHFDLLPYPLPSAIRFGGTTTVLIAASVTALLAWLVGSAIHELSISRAEFARLSRTDSLSGLLNRRAFLDQMETASAPGFLVLFDIDRFKTVNDRHGHGIGDTVLRCVSEELARTFGAPHAVGRHGGEEFAVFIASGDPDDCFLLVEEARRAISVRQVPAGEGTISVTISAGIADHAGDRTIDGLFEAADRALYLAKTLGRDRAVHESQSEDLLAPSRRRAGRRA
ncbi:GGDEF domain-containing protein, partial [Rhizobium sp. TRM95111]|uniref:GGDEF domain-containing protein n=1 Tax=Rhizobium alarense TaxID=2846851 RepID=UPI001F1E6A4E